MRAICHVPIIIPTGSRPDSTLLTTFMTSGNRRSSTMAEATSSTPGTASSSWSTATSPSSRVATTEPCSLSCRNRKMPTSSRPTSK